MFIDTQETFSDGQSVAAAVGTIASTNTYDTGAAADVGIGEVMYLYAKMDTALAGVGSSIQVVLQDSADNSSFATVQAGATFATADAGAGVELARMRLPIGLRRYLRVGYVITGATTTDGTASAFLVKDVQAQQYGASGFSVE